jgi:hypothetical protein
MGRNAIERFCEYSGIMDADSNPRGKRCPRRFGIIVSEKIMTEARDLFNQRRIHRSSYGPCAQLPRQHKEGLLAAAMINKIPEAFNRLAAILDRLWGGVKKEEHGALKAAHERDQEYSAGQFLFRL